LRGLALELGTELVHVGLELVEEGEAISARRRRWSGGRGEEQRREHIFGTVCNSVCNPARAAAA